MGAIRELADGYLDEQIALDPLLATYKGVPGHDHELTDFSPDGLAERDSLARRTLARLADLEPADDADRRCGELLASRLANDIARHDAGEDLRPLRVIGSPVGALRAVFDLTRRDTDDDWAVVARRIAAVPEAYARLRTSLSSGMSADLFAAPRQALACAVQAATWAGIESGTTPWFAQYVAAGPASLRTELGRAAVAATDALADFAGWLRETYVPAAAGTPDAVGADRYALAAAGTLGARLDIGEAYGWAWDELVRIETEMVDVAQRLVPDGSIADAFEHLDTAGPAIDGAENLRAWLQDLVDRTVDELGVAHFAIAAPLRRCEVMIAPPGTAAAQYYTAPTADFSRPGRTWNPTMGRTRFPTWGEVSTCYHEAVPGHQLQLAQWVHRAPQLSQFQTTAYVSGNIEGWALYAERLMDELGALDDPGYRLGYLVAQQLRATRVIVDIGMHHGLRFPDGQPFHVGEMMTPELGREFLFQHAGKERDFLDSEWVRYLGWPSQAICYKLGERVWLAGRDAASRRAAREGRAFDLKAWHAAALDLGSTGLDALAETLPTIG